MRASMLLLTAVIAVGCASTPKPPPAPPPDIYSSEDIALIMQMREEGEGLSDVAAVVGGDRRTVKTAERWELARRKALKRSGWQRATSPALARKR